MRCQLVPLRALLESPTRMTKRLEGVAGGFDHAVGTGADEIAEGREELEEECSGMRFGVGGEGVDDASGGSVEGGFFELLMDGWLR